MFNNNNESLLMLSSNQDVSPHVQPSSFSWAWDQLGINN
jgi:hypothetical protein